jgi:hypothetical protein
LKTGQFFHFIERFFLFSVFDKKINFQISEKKMLTIPFCRNRRFFGKPNGFFLKDMHMCSWLLSHRTVVGMRSWLLRLSPVLPTCACIVLRHRATVHHLAGRGCGRASTRTASGSAQFVVFSLICTTVCGAGEDETRWRRRRLSVKTESPGMTELDGGLGEDGARWRHRGRRSSMGKMELDGGAG